MAVVAVPDETTLCRRYVPAVRTFWRRRLRGTEVDELTQETLLRFVQALRRGAVTDPERMGGFILGICRNLARERARTAERRTELFAEFSSALASLDDEPELARYQLAQLEDCLSQITQRSRDVIRFAYIDGHSAAEIASRLAMTEGNVRVVRHRTLEALRTCMGQKIFWEVAS
jgi:RNA polymerase sigma-70 factor (ECF subfamily)